MNTNKAKNKTMNALQYMKEADAMQQLMESIADETIKQHGAMLENANFEDPTTDDDGVFDMNSMLDVVGSDTEQNQPRIYNTPQEELTDEEKDLVVSEYQKYLSTIQDKIIDINNLDVAETVIKPIIGTTKPLVGFLADIINKATNYATSQNSVAASETGSADSAVAGNKSPADIAPQVDTGVDVGGIPATSAPSLDEVPAIGDVSSELSKLDTELGGSIGDNGALGDEGITGIPAPESDLGLGADVAPEGDLGAVVPEGDVAPEGDLGAEIAPDVAPEGDLGENLEDAGEEDEVAGEDLEDAGKKDEVAGEDLEDAGEDEEDEDVKLEAIKNNYLNTLVESKIDSKLEAIKSKILTESVNATKAKLEAIASKYQQKVMVESAEMKITAQLEAIAKKFQAKTAGVNAPDQS